MAKQVGYKAKIKFTISSVLTAIAFVDELAFPEFERMMVEGTSHDSPSGYAEQFSTGKRSLSEFTIKIFWDAKAATHAALMTSFNSETAVAITVEDATATEIIAFNAFVTKLSRASGQDDMLTCDVTIMPTGAPVITLAA